MPKLIKDGLDRLISSIERISKAHQIEPKRLSVGEWEHNRTATDPSRAVVVRCGGWEKVRAEAQRQHEGGEKPPEPETKPEPAPDPVEGALKEAQDKRNSSKLRTTLKGVIEKNHLLEEALNVSLALSEHVTPLRPVKALEVKGERRRGTILACLSDLHLEEQILPESINGWNSYNLEIAKLRVKSFVEGVVWQVRKQQHTHDIDAFVLWLGGDIMSGFIHEELVETNTLSPVETVLFAYDLLCDEVIRPLLEELKVPRFVVLANYGNHGRDTKKKQHKKAAQHSYEWLLFHMIAKQFAGTQIEFQIAPGAHLYFQIYDLQFRFMHGDNVSYFGGIGGPLTPIHKALAEWNRTQHADVTVLGHFHKYMTLNYVIQNGCLSGFSEYALACKFPREPPLQAFVLIDSARGVCDSVGIWVQNRKKEGW